MIAPVVVASAAPKPATSPVSKPAKSPNTPIPVAKALPDVSPAVAAPIVAAVEPTDATDPAGNFPGISLDLGAAGKKVAATARKPVEKVKAKPTSTPTAAEESGANGGRAITIQLKHLVISGVAVVLLIGAAVFGAVWMLRGPQPTQAVATLPVAAPTPPPPAPKAPDLPDVIERVKKGVILLQAWDGRGEKMKFGSGFLIGPGGIAATNHHVIQGAARITARFADGLIAEVDGVLACDEARDIAVLKLNYAFDTAVPLKLAPQAQLRALTPVVAIGHPQGFDYSVTQGIVSAVRSTHDLPEEFRDAAAAPADHQWIQTDAVISGGNSGGPLITADGQVVGINTWISPRASMGFASHARHIEQVLKDAKATATPTKIADYNKAHGGLKRAIVSQVDQLAEYVDALLGEITDSHWQLRTDDDRTLIGHIAFVLSFAGYHGISLPEIEAFGNRLAAIEWNGDEQVAALNAMAGKRLAGEFDKDGDENGVVFFGEVKRVRSDGSYEVRLADTETDALVADLAKEKAKPKVGAQVLIIGGRIADRGESRPMVASAITVTTKWTPTTAAAKNDKTEKSEK